MKAPQVETLDEAIRLASFIRRAEHNIGFPSMGMWDAGQVSDAWANHTFQAMVDNDWEFIWSDELCQQIMTAWVAYRLSR
jgi:hypothetical protein